MADSVLAPDSRIPVAYSRQLLSRMLSDSLNFCERLSVRLSGMSWITVVMVIVLADWIMTCTVFSLDAATTLDMILAKCTPLLS